MSWTNLLKKEKYMPFLPIIKAKNLFRVGNLEFTQILDTNRPETQKHYNQWKSQTQGLRNEAIGVVGRSANKPGKEYRDTLFEHIFDHVVKDVQRPNQPKRDGAEKLMTLLENVIEDDDTPVSDQDASDIGDLVEHIRKMGEPNSKLNPANIPFTQPRELVEPKREGEKWGKRGSERIYGHYRTPMYQEMRQKVYGEKSPPKAGKAEWYSDAQDGSARPPFWQGLFAQSSVSAEAGGELTRGLLGILEELEKAVEGAKLGDFTVIDKRKASDKKFINGLTTNQELMDRLKAALKNTAMYRRGEARIHYPSLLAEINGKPYTNKKWIDNDLGLQQLIMGADLSDMPVGWKKVERYNLELTIASIDNIINQEIRGKDMMAPTGKPYILRTDSASKLKKYPWHSQYVAASRPVKKSWIDMLWG